MKVLIVNPSRFYAGDWGGGTLSHLFTIYSYLRRHSPGVEVDVLDFEQEMFRPDTEEQVERFLRIARLALQASGFDIVGISCWTSLHYTASLAVARLCKELNPECRVVVGGYHPSALPGDFTFPGSPFDDVVTGEGEIAFQQIVAGEIPRQATTQVIAGTRLNPGEEELCWEEYRYFRNADALGLWLTRGCPFSCGFCLDRLSSWRGYTPARAVAEIKRMVATFPRLRKIGLLDPIFGLNRPWRREFLAGLLEADLDVSFWGETRGDLLEEEDIRMLGRLRFQMDIGLDAVSPRMIAIMMKAKQPEKYLNSFVATSDAMSRYRVPHLIYGILNYPGETSQTLNETLDFWMGFCQQRQGGYGMLLTQTFKFFPGCEVAANIARYGERYGTRVLHPEWWKMDRGPYVELSSQVVASRELAEAGKLYYHTVIKQTAELMSYSALATEALEILAEPLARRPTLQVADPAYYTARRLRVADGAWAHKRLNTRLRLCHLSNGEHHDCSDEETRWVEALGEGVTVGELAARAPDPARVRARLAEFAGRMIKRRLLEVVVAPPDGSGVAEGPARVTLLTNVGPISCELFPNEVPRTVANFLYLALQGFYDQLFLHRSYPGAYFEVGPYVTWSHWPGYRLAAEPGRRRHERGALSMDVAANPALFTICRTAWPELDGKGTVFGQVVAGGEVLDELTRNDILLGVQVTDVEAHALLAAAEPAQ